LNKKAKETQHWNQVAKRWPAKGYANQLLAEHKRRVYLGLIDRWVKITDEQRILKTDLFAEAFEIEQFLFEIPGAIQVVGIDISIEIVKRAILKANKHGKDGSGYICCDMRRLPLQDNSVDIIISDSSLDHFSSERDIIVALKEFCRVLRVGGTIVLSIDNKNNISYPPYFSVRLWMKLGLSPYFIGKTMSLSELRKNLQEMGLAVQGTTTIFHYPHPDALVRWTESALRKISGGRLDNAIRKGLALMERTGGKWTRLATGRYIALKAIKVKE
jgi:SAM-dependent methyltransferase